jgi:hypothetical protein
MVFEDRFDAGGVLASRLEEFSDRIDAAYSVHGVREVESLGERPTGPEKTFLACRVDPGEAALLNFFKQTGRRERDCWLEQAVCLPLPFGNSVVVLGTGGVGRVIQGAVHACARVIITVDECGYLRDISDPCGSFEYCPVSLRQWWLYSFSPCCFSIPKPG